MLLLIPGPVTTHPEVKAAFSQDYAPWDLDFRALHMSLQGCGHPIEMFEQRIAMLEGPESARATATGMSGVTADLRGI